MNASNQPTGGDASNRHPRKCQATKRNGEPCGRWAIEGGTVCPTHGGSIKRVKEAAQRRLAEEEARRAATVYGLPVEVDPHDALLQELHRTAGHVAWLATEVETLPDKRFLYERTMTGTQASAQVQVYQQERKHLASVAAACIKAGIDQRRVEIEEEHARRVVKLLEDVLSELGVEQTPDVRQVVARHLRAVA